MMAHGGSSWAGAAARPASTRQHGGAAARMTLASPSEADARDAVWLSRTRDGDGQAFEALMRAHSVALRNYIQLTVGSYDAAEDVVQDLWVWFWQNRAN